jgi:putative phosphonate metabolism protein
MSARYAIYFAPEAGSPWWQFGAHWLGRDEGKGLTLRQPALTQLKPDALHSMTSSPRRYGFHATLKAPFGLATGCTVVQLQSRLRTLARTLRPLALGPLQATTLGDFVALAPVQPPEGLMQLAAACVRDLDGLRRPLDADDLTRRKPEEMDPRALELLHQYGYPHVLERFQFHFSLTGPVTAESAQTVLDEVRDRVAHLNATEPLRLDRLCLFVEPGHGQAFTRMTDVELQA